VSMFGLKEAEVAELVRGVSADDPDRESIEERFARATLAGIAEPGDRIAGAVIAAIGPARALAAVLERWSPAVFAAVVPGIPEPELDLAQQRWQPRINSGGAMLALRQAARYGTRLMVPGQEHWPTGIDDLGDHGPFALWVRGTEEALAALPRSIALVGARAATGYGEHVTMEASAGLVDRGYAIVSGAAYGVDGMAHRAALASHGKTIAFLAGGVDRFYPTGHEALLTRVVESGAVISELPPGSAPTRWRFLQRNRLIAAASLATVVLEAGWRSGSINTANHAATLSRPVGAVPGPVTSAASAGCHRLVREYGATLVTTPDEMAELAPLQPLAAVEPGAAPDPEATRVLDALSSRSPRLSRDVAARSGLSVAGVESVLGRLELEGIVRESERGWLRRAR
jgi:DNA processing protein